MAQLAEAERRRDASRHPAPPPRPPPPGQGGGGKQFFPLPPRFLAFYTLFPLFVPPAHPPPLPRGLFYVLRRFSPSPAGFWLFSPFSICSIHAANSANCRRVCSKLLGVPASWRRNSTIFGRACTARSNSRFAPGA